MAQHKSAIKAHKQSLKRALRNRATKTKIKTYSKKVEEVVKSKDLTQAIAALRQAESIIMKAVTKNVLKLNTASRKVSKLAHKVKSIEESVATA
ncbi:30S ribosomal protein S20 [Candidatus Bandiella euplotis]|uniref:Small ribosomal subunit protein bS20 n=1 Tax=Candidatus Bandiella euplotis TaxID=1664265 RepID=A0ABZ0UJN2_9RICK|nr:30S ribosomal protein S20 [Candidatus Bandiella woodruffii]WPX95914.1 30S ribosomal protein S20 [Candidatus Bandiella woodruffii]